MTAQRSAGAAKGRMRVGAAPVAALLLLAAMSACTGAAGPSSSPANAPTTDPTGSAASAAFDPGADDSAGPVDIGGSRDLYLDCSGTGSPTVVLISGAGVAADNWRYAVAEPGGPVESAVPSDSAVFPETARFTRVCAYDRPGTQPWDGGMSRSTPVPQPTTTQAGAADLHALLAAAEIPGPYVIVGHSLGGLIATTFARTYPDEVVGVVLVDPASQFLQTTLPAEVWSQWMQSVAAAGAQHPELESPDYPSSLAALEATPPLPPMPAAVLSADQPFDYLGIGEADAYWPDWLEAHALLAASLGATHVTQTDSGHFVANVSPALVVEQICAAIAPAGGC